jgi:hypothetical protein
MTVTSVEALQLRPDAHRLAQDSREHPALRGALETREAATGVRATAGRVPTGDEVSAVGREPEKLALRRPPAAAGAGPQRFAYEDSSSGASSATSTGIPAGTSSGSPTSASGATSGSSGASQASISISSTSASASSASAGGPAT